MENIIEITNANFDEMVAKHDFLLLDFWADWCAPCKAFSKVVAEIAGDYSHVTFGCINVDSEPSLAEEFGVKSIPRIMVLRNQTVIYDESGSLSVDGLRDLLNASLKHGDPR